MVNCHESCRTELFFTFLRTAFAVIVLVGGTPNLTEKETKGLIAVVGSVTAAFIRVVGQ